MSGRIIPTVLEKGWGFSGVGPVDLAAFYAGSLARPGAGGRALQLMLMYYYVRIIRLRLLEARSSASSGQAWFEPCLVSRPCHSSPVSPTLNKGVREAAEAREAAAVFITLLRTAPNLTLRNCFSLEFSM